MIDTEAIRAVFAALADEAPPPDRIRANLATRARRYRQRRLVLRLAGVGVAAASTGVAGAGVWRLTRPSDPGFPVVDGGTGGGWLEVPLRHRPTWLPHEYGETRRSFVVVGDQAPVVSRDWQPADAARDGTGDLISLLVGWHPSLAADRPSGQPTPVDVNGVSGQLVQVHQGEMVATYLTWQPPGQPQLIVAALTRDGADPQKDLAVRVARSVRADPGRTWVGPQFGWMPTDLPAVPWRLVLEYNDRGWVQSVSVTGTDGRQLNMVIGPGLTHRRDNTAPVQPIRVRGMDAWQVPENHQLFLTTPDGVEVFAQLDAAPGGDPMPDLIRVVEGFDFGPWPDMGWVGGR